MIFIKRYMTDASAYRIRPWPALPKTSGDIVKLVRFAEKHKISLTREQQEPLGWANCWDGIIVDVSKHRDCFFDIKKEL
jgi:hypothetical protein